MASSPKDSAVRPSGKLREAKLALRSRILAQRDGLAAHVRDAQGQAITAALAARSDFLQSATVLLTLPFGSEWDTRTLLALALSQGKNVALPRVRRERRTLDICRVADLSVDVSPGYRGIPEPLAHCSALDAAAIDWALIPGVAFDSGGGRLGYGGGYYDRLLPLLRPDAQRIAGAFDVQIVDQVPAAAHDLAVDAVVTPTRTFASHRAVN